MDDLRHALRQVLRAPGFAAIVILTLGLCIGANTAIFSVVDAVLLRPYPWPESNRLVYVYNTYPKMNLPNAGVSIPDYFDRRNGVKGFSDSAIFHGQSFNLGFEGEPERLQGMVASASLFSTLQAGAALGRVYSDADAAPGAPATAVLSHDLWQHRFGGDRSILGRTIRLNSEPVTVIGIMPAGFYFPGPKTQLWTPFVIQPAEKTDKERGREYSSMIARLADGATGASVQSELDAIERANEERLPGARSFWRTSGFGARTQTILDQTVGNVRPMLWLIQGGVVAALLIGCANVASLLLARAVARERELAIRSALGAGRGRLTRMLLAESVVLFGFGGLLGLGLSWWGVRALDLLGVAALPRAFGIRVDGAALGFTLACALLTGLIFGAFPAWTASGGNASAALKEAGNRGGTAGRRTQALRRLLVAGEIALAAMLVSTALLLIRSFSRMEAQDPGFRAGGVLTAQLVLPTAKYTNHAQIVGFHDALVARLAALPGVGSVGVTDNLPFTGMNSSNSYTSPDIVLPPNAPLPHAQVRSSDEGFLPTMGLTLLRGRWFQRSDSATAPRVVVIDRVLADRYWPGQDPIGKRINLFNKTPTLVIGEVAPVKVTGLDQDVDKETIYSPFAQVPSTGISLVLRTAGDPRSYAAAVREAVAAADPEQPLFDLVPMEDRISSAAQPRRASMLLLTLFGGVALFLAALGIYGVLAYSVAQRTSEFGVRMALGATAQDIARLVLVQGAILTGIGLAAGFAGYLAVSRLIGSLLYGIGAADFPSLAAALGLLAAVALLAAFLPARRATRVDPMVALRSE